jgi:hypothetical protein
VKKTPQQIQNLKDALVWWKTVPEKSVDLSSWVDDGTPPYTCNTIACFGGWCAVQPKLVAQGVYPDDEGCPRTDDECWPSAVAKTLFGDSRIFAMRCGHLADPCKGSDHTAVTARIKAALKDQEQQ